MNPPATSGSYNMYIAGVRGIDGKKSFVFDDYNATGQYYNWNCGNKFLFDMYLSDQAEIMFAPNPPNNSGSITYHTLKIFYNGGVTPIYTTSVQDGTSFFYTPSNLGYYNFAYYSNGANPDLVGEIYVMKKVSKIWAEVPEIDCNYPVGQDLTITIKADPDLTSVMAHVDQHPEAFGTQGACEQVDDMGIKMDFGGSVPVHNSSFSTFTNNFYYSGFQWDPQAPMNMQQFTIHYIDLMSYLDGQTPLFFNFSYDDKVTKRTLAIPVIINSNNVATNAAAYHLKFYTVGGTNYWTTAPLPENDVWTPQSNPVTRYLTGAATANTIRIEDYLDIPAGASLTIQDMNIEMGPNARIVIHESADGSTPAGYLNLKNTTVHAYQGCSSNSGNLWQGIYACGKNSYSQNLIAAQPNGYLQGTVVMDGCTISDAHEVFSNFSPDMPDRNGGMILASNTHFYNNEHTALFKSYLNSYQMGGQTFYSPYNSHFYNCDFMIDQGGFGGFIKGQEVRGVDIGGCSFTGPTNGWQLANGIEGQDFGVAVRDFNNVHCSFANLNKAIAIGQVNPLYTSMRVLNATFNNNLVGVLAQNITAPTVQYNAMYIPQGPSNKITNSGVQIFGGSGYHVSENTLTGLGNYNNIGVVAWATGSSDNAIKRNNYSGLGAASVSNYSNRSSNPSFLTGLQILCNQNSGNTNDIVAMGGNPATDGIAPNQGSLALPAGNTFSHIGFDIYNPTGQVGAISYYYNLSGNQEQPFNMTSGASKIGIAKGDQCPEDIVPGGPVKPDDGRFSPLNRVVRNVQFYQSNDKGELELDNLQAALSQWDDPHADLSNADLMIETGKIEEANNLYNQIVTKYGLQGQEANEFSTFGRQLLDLRISQVQNGLQSTDLSGENIDLLQSIADNSKMWPKLRAQNWLQKYDGREIKNIVLYPGGDGTERKVVQETAVINSVAPNPAKELLTVSYTQIGKDAPVFELTTIDGKLVRSATLNGNSQQVPLQGLASGLYLYHISENGKIMMQGKITKQ